MRLRSLLFKILFPLESALVSVPFSLLLILPERFNYFAPRLWTHGCMLLLRVCCGITYSIEGREHLPKNGAVLFASKHQSAWETLVFYLVTPRPAFVLKKELLNIPFIGWYMRRLKMIAVDRKAGMRALKGMVDQAVARLEEGRQVVIFPEGTRMAYGEQGKIHSGIVGIYERASLPVHPVFLDSGKCWPKKGDLKKGHITLKIQPPIPAGLPKDQLIERIKHGIEGHH